MSADPFAAPAPSPARRVAGTAGAGLGVVALALFALGAWNPWRLVVLERYFSDPTVGIVAVLAFTLVAFWLLAPVRSEAAQHRRHLTRWALVVAMLPALGCAGIVHPMISKGYERIATSPDGQRQAVFVRHGDDRELRIWAGSGLLVRDAGRAGNPCGPAAKARFTSADLVHVTTDYGDFDIRLDPATGRPLNPMGPTCTG